MNTHSQDPTLSEGSVLVLRAHHGMCLAFFRGEGYSGTFTEHMAKIKASLDRSPDRLLRVTARADDICTACPNLHDRVCETALKTERYDRAVLARCHLEEDTLITWQEFSRRVAENILQAGRRSGICSDCQWDSLCR